MTQDTQKQMSAMTFYQQDVFLKHQYPKEATNVSGSRSKVKIKVTRTFWYHKNVLSQDILKPDMKALSPTS